MTIIERIKAEIERLKKNENDLIENSTKKYGAYPASSDIMLIAYQNVLSFLDSLESENPMSQELEVEMDKFFETMPVLEHENIFEDTFKNIARHFYDLGCTRTAEKYDEIEYNRQRAEEDTQNDLKEAVKNYIYKAADSPGDDWTTDDIRNAFIAGYKCHADHTPLPEDTVLFNKGVEEGKRLMMEEAVKWLVDGDYDPKFEKGRFILGSVGIGYNGYYIPYSDLLKLPKED